MQRGGVAQKRRRSQQQQISRLQNALAVCRRDLRELQEWKRHLYSIHDLDEILRWRKHMTAWDFWLTVSNSRAKVIQLCIHNMTEIPPEVNKIIQQYDS